jgi:phospholipid/cholesterol/gamma-HCH transport system substrate-binding protein
VTVFARLRRKPARREAGQARYLTAAALFVALIAAMTYWAFVRGLPFDHPYEIHGVFANVDQMRQGSAVRIAGIDVGTVADVAPGPHQTAVATLTITDRRVPIHDDATLSIRPRLVLEGNDYVIVNPGTPGAPLLRSGRTIGLGQTNEEVQLDQVLSSLTLPTRQALTGTISNLANALGPGRSPSSGPAGSSVPDTAGSQGLRAADRQLDGGLNSFTAVLDAARGTGPGDLSKAVGSTGELTAQLSTDPAALADFVTSYNRTFAAFAAKDQALAASVSGIDGLLRQAPAELRAIDPALPRLTSFADDLRPALRVAPGPLRNFDGLLGQLAALAKPDALPRLLGELRPVTVNLPPLERQLATLFPLVTSASNCVSDNVVPTMNLVAPDGSNSTGQPIWKDLIHAFASYAGLASDFDGNGSTVRLGISEGLASVTGAIPGLGKLVGIGPKIDGTNPVWLGYGVNPPWRPDQPCSAQPVPNLGADGSDKPPADIHYSPLSMPTGHAAEIVKGLYGTPAQRADLLTSLLASLTGKTAAHTRTSSSGSLSWSPPAPAALTDPGSPGQDHNGSVPAGAVPTGATTTGTTAPSGSPPLGGAVAGAVGKLLSLLGIGGGH